MNSEFASRSRPRVCFMTSVHMPFDVRIFHKECRSLARAGYPVTLIACHGKQEEVVDDVRIRGIFKAAGRLSRMTLTPWTIAREAMRQNAQIYHFHDPELIPVGLFLRVLGKKVIYDVHEDLPADVAYKH